MKLLRKEPAMVAGAMVAGLTMGAAFGLPVSTGQVAAVGSFLTIVAALVVRSQVSPTSKP